MVLLWLNITISGVASAIYFLWGLKWWRRRHILLSSLYAGASVSGLLFALGFVIVLLDGNPAISASVSREWVWGVVGLPAVARFVELVREERRHVYADRLLTKAEKRETNGHA